MKKQSVRCAVVAAAIGLGVIAGGASAVSAGEVTGNGKSLKNEDGTLNGRSACAFSGLDDADDDGFGRTQNWGQIPQEEREFLTSIGVNPGVACNPNNSFEE